MINRGIVIPVGFLTMGMGALWVVIVYGSVVSSVMGVITALALVSVAAGLVLLIERAREMPCRTSHSNKGSEFRILSANCYFFVLEFAKVVSVVFLVPLYPLEAFFLFVVLDCLDGLSLSHEKRSLMLRHRIDKCTDFLSQIPMYLVTLLLWPELFLIFTIFLILSLIKTVWFVWTGQRRVLVYLPCFFLVFYLSRSIMHYFFRSFDWIFTNFFCTVFFTLLIMIIAVFYELIYNGILYRLRYSEEEIEAVE